MAAASAALGTTKKEKSEKTVKECPLCGDPGHRGRECPLLSPDTEEEEMKVDQGYAEGTRKKASQPASSPMPVTPPSRVRRPLDPYENATKEETASPEWDMISELTQEEKQIIAKRRTKTAATKAKRATQAALTGEAADFPSLSHVWSSEMAMNMVFSLASRMRVFLWKKLLWQLRVKDAVERTMKGARWKRNPRWLSRLLGKEVAAVYGHYGAMRQKMNNPDTWHLM